VLLGHATLGEMCGGAPTLDDVEMLRVASSAWHAAEHEAHKKASKQR
jgi:hypothetical protein